MQGHSNTTQLMFMKDELDRVSVTISEPEKDRVSRLFTRACELEVAFFDSVHPLRALSLAFKLVIIFAMGSQDLLDFMH